MSLETSKSGRRVTLRCDACGRPTRSLKRVTGQWLNPKTGRKVTSGAAWVCPTCLTRMRRGDAL